MMLYKVKEYVEAHGLDEFDYGARGYYSTIIRFGTVDPMAEKYYDTSPYAYCMNNPVKHIDPNGMDVWSTTDPEEIRLAIESLMRGGSVRYNDNWIHKRDNQFLNLRGDYSAGLNYNTNTGQLWYLSGSGMGGAYVSQLTQISKGALYGYNSAGYGSFDELVGSEAWQNMVNGLNGTSFVVGGMSRAGARAMERTLAYSSSISPTKATEVMFKLPGANMYLPTNVVRGGVRALKTGGYALGGIGLFATGYEIYIGEKDIFGEGGLDLLMGGVAFIPGYGWIVSGVYFGSKYVLESTENDFWNKP